MGIVKEVEWRSAGFAPSDIDMSILYCTKNGRFGFLKNTKGFRYGDVEPHSEWYLLVDKYNIAYWTYLNEISPMI